MILSNQGTVRDTAHSVAVEPSGDGSTLGGWLQDPVIAQALQVLFRAGQLADDCARPRVDFPLCWGELQQAGVSTAVLQWLVAKRLAMHWTSAATNTGERGIGEAPRGALPTAASWFSLSDAGWRLAEEAISAAGLPLPGLLTCSVSSEWNGRSAGSAALAGPVAADAIPSWDGERHELRCGSALIKRFKWRASNQERILAAFEEEGWPPRIDDPLPPRAEIDSKRRLGDTIKCLNRNHLVPLLRFVGDGSGQGVIWELQFSRPRKTK